MHRLKWFLVVAGLSVVAVPAARPQSVIKTYAGGGPDGAPALSATVPFPAGLAVSGEGVLYIASSFVPTSPYSNHVFAVEIEDMRGAPLLTYTKWHRQTQTLRVVAGNGAGFSGDGGLAKNAEIDCLDCGVAADGEGNLFLADTFNHRIRRVDAETGIITTVAGSGPAGNNGGGFSGDGGPATSALLNSPSDVAVDGAGNLFISDAGNFRVRRVDARTGIITTVAGDGRAGYGGDGGPATLATFRQILAIALDSANNILIADFSNYRIRRIDAVTGIVSTVAGDGQPGYSGDGGPATAASLGLVEGLTADAAGDVFFSDIFNGAPASSRRIRRVDAKTGIIATVAGNGAAGFSGDGGPATSATFDSPSGVALDGEGNLFIADRIDHRVRRVDAETGIIATVAGDGSFTFGGDGGPATSASILDAAGVTADVRGNVFFADAQNQRIRRVDGDTGIITTVAGNGQNDFGGDGGLATDASLSLGPPYFETPSNTPNGLAVDVTGNLYIADTLNQRVRRVDAGTGFISTVAGNGQQGFGGDGSAATNAILNTPAGLALDPSGNLFIADSSNFRVRRVDAHTGVITTVAGNGQQSGNLGDGGAATNATVAPLGVAADSSGNLFIADTGNHRIRRVDASSGIITTVAGAPHPMGDCDGPFNVPATQACLSSPMGVSLDRGGNLFITEQYIFACRVLRVDASTGILTELAGDGGTCGFSGDGGPAVGANVAANAIVVAPDGSGNVFITSGRDNRIRIITQDE